MPFTATTREGACLGLLVCFTHCSGLLLPNARLHAGSLAHAAHTLSPSFLENSVVVRALQGHGAVTRKSVTGSRVQVPFLPSGDSRLELTSQACQ